MGPAQSLTETRPGPKPHPLGPGRQSGLAFSVAGTVECVTEAWRLLYRAYARAGFIRPNRHRLHTPPEAAGEHTAVIVGRIQRVTVSTISAIGDNPLGLPLDHAYPEELGRLRADGRRLIEIGLFGDRRDVTADGDRTFGSIFELIRFAYYFGRRLGATDYLCGIPPRRARLYARAFGFHPVGEPRTYSTVEDNPVQLMRVEAAHLLEHHARYRAIDYFVKHPLPMNLFDARYRFDSRSLPGSALGRYLDDAPPEA